MILVDNYFLATIFCVFAQEPQQAQQITQQRIAKK